MQKVSGRAIFALVVVCLIWGSTYLVNKLGVSRMPPLFFTTVRQLVAGTLILIYFFVIRKNPWPDRKYFAKQIPLGILLIGVGNGVGTFGLQFIDSSISAIMAALSPVIIAIMTVYYKPEDKLTPEGWLGIGAGFVGILIICYDKLQTPGDHSKLIIGLSLSFLSIACWALGTVWSKNYSFPVSPFITAGFHMVFGGIPVAVLSFCLESWKSVHVGPDLIIIWLYLIFFGSIVAYSAYIYALKHLPATIVSIQSYINPIIALILGAVILHEPHNLKIISGAAITLLGVLLINYSYIRSKRKKTNISFSE